MNRCETLEVLLLSIEFGVEFLQVKLDSENSWDFEILQIFLETV
jgi:hypothetical protein